MQRAFGVILSQRLYYPNSKAVFSLLKIKNCFTNRSALLLFPLKNFFYVAVLDNRYALVKIEKLSEYDCEIPAFPPGSNLDVAFAIQLKLRAYFPNYFSAAITHREKGVARYSLQRFIRQDAELS